MPFEPDEERSGRDRDRSKTPNYRRRRASTVDCDSSRAQGNKKARYPHHDTRSRQERSVTVFTNSSGPQIHSGPVFSEYENADNKQAHRDKIAQLIRERDDLKEENEDLKEEITKVWADNDTLKEDKASLDEDVRGYRRVIKDLSLACDDLRNRMEELEQNTASANRGSSWLGALLPKSRDDQKPEEIAALELRAKVSEYERQAVNDADYIRELEEQHEMLKKEATAQEKRMHAQTAEFALELENLKRKEGVKAPKMSDTELQRKWKALNFSVRQFISTHLPGALDLETVQRLAQLNDFRWLPEMARTLQTPFLCPLIFESWIWHFLCFRVFDSHSNFWAGKMGKDFKAQCDQIRDYITNHPGYRTPPTAAIARYHDWRVRSAHFISELEPYDKVNSSKELTEGLLRTLKHLRSRTDLPAQSSVEMHHDALKIVRKAAELDEFFKLSKADFHVFITRVKLPLVKPPSFGFAFDPETMERINHNPFIEHSNASSIVDLAVSPGIFKAGNSDGGNYDSERVLVKLQALCGLQATLESFGGETASQEADDGHLEQLLKMSDVAVYIKQEPGAEEEVDMLRPEN